MATFAQMQKGKTRKSPENKAFVWSAQGINFALSHRRFLIDKDTKPEVITYLRGPKNIKEIHDVRVWILILMLQPEGRAASDRDVENIQQWVNGLGGNFTQDYQEMTSSENDAQLFIWMEVNGEYRKMPWVQGEVQPDVERYMDSLRNPTEDAGGAIKDPAMPTAEELGQQPVPATATDKPN